MNLKKIDRYLRSELTGDPSKKHRVEVHTNQSPIPLKEELSEAEIARISTMNWVVSIYKGPDAKIQLITI